MEKFEVKILSYIGNFRKVIFICPLCRENNSLILDREDITEVDYKCDVCRRSYRADLKSLQGIISTIRK